MLEVVESLQRTLHYFMLNACLTIVSQNNDIFKIHYRREKNVIIGEFFATSVIALL